ncbi:MAG: ECF transporter S component [Bacillota bacterium]
MKLTQRLAILGLLLAVVVLVQMFKLGQIVTGSAVNALLFLAALSVGPAGALIGLVSPWAALLVGAVSPALLPALPFISVSNMALVLTYAALLRYGRWVAMLPAAAVKFVILAAAVRFLVQLPAPAALALGYPQLVTALIGGSVAALAWPLLARAKSA